MPAAHDNKHLRGNLKLSLKWLTWHGAPFRKCAFLCRPSAAAKAATADAVAPAYSGCCCTPSRPPCLPTWYERYQASPSLPRLSSCVAASRPCHDVVGHAATERTDQGKPPWLPWGVTCLTRLAGSSRAAQGGRNCVRS